MKRVIALLIVLAVCSMAALAEAPTLTVKGTGVVTMNPDTATITLGVRQTAKDVTEAQNAVSERLTGVIDALKAAGIKPEDIHTSHISIYENYDYSSSFAISRESNYVAENTIQARFSDIENAGKYIDAVFQAGANTFNGISFSASDTEAEKQRALELSVQNARKKADVLAAAAGMKITGILAIGEEYDYGGNYYNSNSFDAMFAKAATTEGAVETPVMADQIQVSATVTVQYAMEPVE